VFAAGPHGSTWATIAEVVTKVMGTAYQFSIDEQGSVERNPRLVGDGQAHLGVTNPTAARGAVHGTNHYSHDGPRPGLRLLGLVYQPNWEGFAVRAELGITDLQEIADRKPALRLIGGDGVTQRKVWEHYGLSPELIESWGGTFYGHPNARPDNRFPLEQCVRDGTFDMIVTPISAGFAPDTYHWHYASLLYDLRFLPLPHEVVQEVCEAAPGGHPGFIPHDLYRGVEVDTRAVSRPWRLIIARQDLPEDFAYSLVKELDRGQELFRSTHLNLTFIPGAAKDDHGIELHAGAQRYYRDAGYLD
jgi:uncharacterized protein